MSREVRLIGFDPPKTEPLSERQAESFKVEPAHAGRFGEGTTFVRKGGNEHGAYWVEEQHAQNITDDRKYRSDLAIHKEWQPSLSQEHSFTVRPGETVVGYSGTAASQVHEIRPGIYRRLPGGGEQVVFTDREMLQSQDIKTTNRESPPGDGSFGEMQDQLRRTTGRSKSESAQIEQDPPSATKSR